MDDDQDVTIPFEPIELKLNGTRSFTLLVGGAGSRIEIVGNKFFYHTSNIYSPSKNDCHNLMSFKVFVHRNNDPFVSDSPILDTEEEWKDWKADDHFSYLQPNEVYFIDGDEYEIDVIYKEWLFNE